MNRNKNLQRILTCITILIMRKINNKKGFTIAEIAISFVLIAGIAMILMPVIFSNTQNQVLMTALNKNYTVLQDIHQSIPLLQARGKIASGQIDATIFMQAVVLTQKCIDIQSNGQNIGHTVSANYKFEQYINGYANKITPNTLLPNPSQFSLDNMNNTTVILKNNVYISTYSNGGTTYIMVDINGKKMPNATGKDIFFFEIVNSSVGNDSNNSVFRPITFNNNCTVGGAFANSQGCADKYLQAGSMN